MKHSFSGLLGLAFILLGTLVPSALLAENRTKASDSRITYLGRTLVKDGEVSFDWTAVYFRVRFTGGDLSMVVSDTKRNYYNVWIDKTTDNEPDKVVATFGKDSVVSLVTKAELVSMLGKKNMRAALGEHRVTVMKRTEGEQGTTTIKEFITEGEIIQAEGVRDRVIEFVGDSYTCGYGSENSVSTDPFTPETENSNKTYAAVLSRYFGADMFVVAHSGMGIARNYNDKFRDTFMPDRYLHTFDMDDKVTWNAAACGVVPDITVIYLGANDFSVLRQPVREDFRKHYMQLLSEIKANYGEEHKILCIAPKDNPGIYDYVSDVVSRCGLKNVYSLGICQAVYSNDERGASSHPNYAAHRKIAYTVLPYIATITGWEITDRPLK